MPAPAPAKPAPPLSDRLRRAYGSCRPPEAERRAGDPERSTLLRRQRGEQQLGALVEVDSALGARAGRVADQTLDRLREPGLVGPADAAAAERRMPRNRGILRELEHRQVGLGVADREGEPLVTEQRAQPSRL